MTRLAICAAIGALALAGCGKYGPPVRAHDVPSKTAPVTVTPATSSNADECADPNAVSAEAKP